MLILFFLCYACIALLAVFSIINVPLLNILAIASLVQAALAHMVCKEKCSHTLLWTAAMVALAHFMVSPFFLDNDGYLPVTTGAINAIYSAFITIVSFSLIGFATISGSVPLLNERCSNITLSSSPKD